MENHPVLCKCHVYPNSDLSLWLSWLKLIDSRLQSWAEPPLSLSCDISSAQLFLAQLDWLSCFELSCGNTNSEVLTGSELTAHKSMHRDDYNLWHWRLGQHFSHPFLGTYEVVQFFELGNLKGTHSGVMYGPHPNSMVPWHGTPIPYPVIPIPSHLIPIPSHTIIPNLSQGVWGPFYKICKFFLHAAILVHWTPFFLDRFFRFLLTF